MADAAWAELLQRALVEQNDAAWDLLVNCLWFPIIAWLYERAPNQSPATAEQIAQQVLLALRAQALDTTVKPDLATTTRLIQFLQGQLDQLLG